MYSQVDLGDLNNHNFLMEKALLCLGKPRGEREGSIVFEEGRGQEKKFSSLWRSWRRLSCVWESPEAREKVLYCVEKLEKATTRKGAQQL